MMKRKITCIILALIISIGCSTPSVAFAEEPENSEKWVTLTEDIAARIASNFATDFYPDENLEIGSMVPFCDTNGAAAGFIVNYTSDNIQYGYVIIDPDAKGSIAEYSIGPDAESPHEAAIEEDPTAEENLKHGQASVIQISPIDYGVVEKGSDDVLLGDGSTVSTEDVMTESAETKAKDPATWGEASIPIADLYKDYSITSSGNLPQWVSTTQDRVIELTGRYACSVTAYFAVAGYYGLVDTWNDGDAYTQIWDYTGTHQDPFNPDTDILWGSTNIDAGAAGFANYCNMRGMSVTQRTTSGKPDFGEYVDSVNGQDASVLHGWLWFDDGGTLRQVGHTMFVEGYIGAINKDDLTGLRILQVFDGWYSGVRYINFDFDNYANFRGSFFAN